MSPAPLHFICWQPDHGSTVEDGRRVRAYDAECAAENYARDDDARSADYLIAGGQPAEVHVFDGEVTHRFMVSGRSEPVYFAKPIK